MYNYYRILKTSNPYTYFNNSIRSFINTKVPLEYLYNILSLGNNSYLLKF